MDFAAAALRIPHWTQIPDGTPYEVSIEVCRRCVMTALAAESGGHIGVVVDRVLEGHLFSISPGKTALVTIPDKHEDRRMLLDQAVVSTHPEVEDSVATLWETMRQYRAAQIERDAQALLQRWLQL